MPCQTLPAPAQPWVCHGMPAPASLWDDVQAHPNAFRTKKTLGPGLHSCQPCKTTCVCLLSPLAGSPGAGKGARASAMQPQAADEEVDAQAKEGRRGLLIISLTHENGRK